MGSTRGSSSAASPTIGGAGRCAACTTRPRPHEENKMVSCLRGVDLRRRHRPAAAPRPLTAAGSAATLTDAGLETLFVPKGCAHGFITLSRRHPGPLRDLGVSSPGVGTRRPLRRSVLRDRVAARARRHQRTRSRLSSVPRPRPLGLKLDSSTSGTIRWTAARLRLRNVIWPCSRRSCRDTVVVVARKARANGSN